MLEKGCFDAVYIATPHTSHAEYAIKAMQAGKSVLCEKPVGISSAEVERMQNAAKENTGFSHGGICLFKNKE